MNSLGSIATAIFLIAIILSIIRIFIFKNDEKSNIDRFKFEDTTRLPYPGMFINGQQIIGIFKLDSPEIYLHSYYFFATEINSLGASGYAHAKHTGYKRGYWTYVWAEFDSNGFLTNSPSANKTNYKPVPYTRIVREVSLIDFESNLNT